MNATARLEFNRQYYELRYDDWLKYRAKWRKYSVSFSCLLVLFGLGLFYGIRDQWIFGIFVSVVGVVELIFSLTHKRRWVRTCLRAACTGKTLVIRFEDGLVNSTSRNGTSSIKMSAFESIVPASQGVFLVPDNGQAIYLPKNAFDLPETYQPLVQFLLNSLEKDSDS
jgi:hypothetical protein